MRHQPEFVEVFVKPPVVRQVSVSEFLAVHVFAGVQWLRVVHRAERLLPADQADQMVVRRLERAAETVGMEEVGV